MEKRVSKIYSEAVSDISKKWDAYMKSHASKVDQAHKNLLDAIKSGDKDSIKEAKEVYERTAKNVTVNNKRFVDMVEETTAKMSHTNEVALSYVNNQMPKIYTVNYNAFGSERIKGYSFSLVNEQAVKNLVNTKKLLLPTKHLDVAKDKLWNKKFINSQMIQGILQGESIPKLSARIFPELMRKSDMKDLTDEEIKGIIKKNKEAAIRNARTMTTAAENKGRQDSYVKATEDGVILKRIWVATKDERTRAWHMELDGVEVDVDEPWSNEYGDIMEPGDPSADPANVYNCRCAMRVDVKGFRWNE